MLRLGSPTFLFVARLESLYRREKEQQNQNPLRHERLHTGINAHRIDVGRSRNDRNRYHVRFLELANPLTHEHEGHVVEQDARDGEERTHWYADAVSVEECENHGERCESDKNSQSE